METIEKESFTVIGKQGSTEDGAGFITRLWNDANEHFDQINDLVKRDSFGIPTGCWGAMSDMSLSFKPWEDDFSKGLYLAGMECEPDTVAPEGWTKWTVPGFRFVAVPYAETSFAKGLEYLEQNGYQLAGAVQDFTDPASGLDYMMFPIARLDG